MTPRSTSEVGPHARPDEAGRRASARWAALRSRAVRALGLRALGVPVVGALVVGALVVGAAGTLLAVASTAADPPASLGELVAAAVLGALAWAGVTATGLAAVRLVHRRQGRSPDTDRSGVAASLAAGALASGVATPVAALAVALALPHVLGGPGSLGPAWAGLGWLGPAWAGLGWLAVAVGAEVAAALHARAMSARSGVGQAGARERRREVAAFMGALGTAIAFATWTFALGVLPVLVVVLVPFHVALVALRVRAEITSRGEAAESTLPA